VAKKIGVDPLKGGNFKGTPDMFFSINEQEFDVIFIDGLHTYEQVRKDVENSLKCLKKGGYLVLHDLIPRNWVEQHRPRLLESGPYVSDGWKISFELKNLDDVNFRLVRIDHGVGVLRKLKGVPTIGLEPTGLAQEKFEYFMDNLDQLPLIEWEEFLEWAKD